MVERQPRQRDERHLAFIRSQRCCLCGTDQGVQAAHLRTGSINDGKPYGAMQMKSSDKWALPLCKRHHDMQHSMNEAEFWSSFGVLDPFALAMQFSRKSNECDG
jgi:hypothetical protein